MKHLGLVCGAAAALLEAYQAFGGVGVAVAGLTMSVVVLMAI